MKKSNIKPPDFGESVKQGKERMRQYKAAIDLQTIKRQKVLPIIEKPSSLLIDEEDIQVNVSAEEASVDENDDDEENDIELEDEEEEEEEEEEEVVQLERIETLDAYHGIEMEIVSNSLNLGDSGNNVGSSSVAHGDHDIGGKTEASNSCWTCLINTLKADELERDHPVAYINSEESKDDEMDNNDHDDEDLEDDADEKDAVNINEEDVDENNQGGDAGDGTVDYSYDDDEELWDIDEAAAEGTNLQDPNANTFFVECGESDGFAMLQAVIGSSSATSLGATTIQSASFIPTMSASSETIAGGNTAATAVGVLAVNSPTTYDSLPCKKARKEARSKMMKNVLSKATANVEIKTHQQYINHFVLNTDFMMSLIDDRLQKYMESCHYFHYEITSKRYRNMKIHRDSEATMMDKVTDQHRYNVEHNIPIKARHEALLIEQKYYQPLGIEIPIGRNPEETHRIFLSMQQPKLDRHFDVHVCPTGCMAFFGDNHKVSLTSCTICGAARTAACTRPQCMVEGVVCPHPPSSKIPSSRLHYYSLILRIISDILTKKLPQLINHSDTIPSISNENPKIKSFDNRFVHDICATEFAKKEMIEMINAYLSLNDPDAIPIYLLFCDGEDGIQLWSTKTGRYDNLVVSWLNIPPCKRGEYGVTMSLISTYNLEEHCEAEQSLFIQGYSVELRLLYHGFMKLLPDRQNSKMMQKYFIIARNIAHLFDTEAFKKRMHSAASGSKVCAPCQKVGIKSPETLSVLFLDNRMELEPLHWLRYISNCRLDPKNTDHIPYLNYCWDSPVPKEYFINAVKFGCIEERIRPLFNLITKDQYCEWGWQAYKGTNRESRVVRGISGISPHALQPNFDYCHQCGFDAGHDLSGVVQNVVGCLNGKRGKVTIKIAKMSREEGFYLGQINSELSTPPWRIVPADQTEIESILHCINFPSSLSSQYKVENFLTKSANLNMDHNFKVAMVVLEYAVKLSNLARPYKALYTLLAMLITHTLMMVVDKDAIQLLHKQVKEALCLCEGMLPLKECTFIKHEWEHIVDSLPHMGPVISHNTLVFERAYSYFKRWAPRGGRNYALTISKRNIEYEQMKDEQALRQESQQEEDKINHGQHTAPEEVKNNSNDHGDAEDSETEKVEPSLLALYRTGIVESTHITTMHFSFSEWDRIFYTLVLREIQMSGLDCLLHRSPIVRVYHLYECLQFLIPIVDEEYDIDGEYLPLLLEKSGIRKWFYGMLRRILVEVPARDSSGGLIMEPSWSKDNYNKFSKEVSLLLSPLSLQYYGNDERYLFIKRYVLKEARRDNEMESVNVIEDFFAFFRMTRKFHPNSSVNVYQRAFVFGLPLESRGSISIVSIDTVRSNWFTRKYRNSWCKSFAIGLDNDVVHPAWTNFEEQPRWSLCDFFFEIIVDPAVDEFDIFGNGKVARFQVASVSRFSSSPMKDYDYGTIERIDLFNTVFDTRCFVLLKDLESTRVATVSYDSLQKPYCLKKVKGSQRHVYSSKQKVDCRWIDTLPLHPNRYHIRKAIKESKLLKFF